MVKLIQTPDENELSGLRDRAIMETLYSIDRTKKYSVTPEIEMGSSGL